MKPETQKKLEALARLVEAAESRLIDFMNAWTLGTGSGGGQYGIFVHLQSDVSTYIDTFHKEFQPCHRVFVASINYVDCDSPIIFSSDGRSEVANMQQFVEENLADFCCFYGLDKDQPGLIDWMEAKSPHRG